MLSARIKYENQKDKLEYIKECENGFASDITNAENTLLGHDKLKFIFVCGPSCSGKTTASDMLISRLASRGKKIEIISIDDYYKNRNVIISECQKKGIPTDFESISSLDFQLFEKTLSELSNASLHLEIPVFDFKEGKRCGYRSISNTDDTLILFEGIQTVYPEISSLLYSYETEGVRIGVFEDVKVGNNILSMTDTRLLRRIIRDVYKRSTSPSETLKLWDSVRQNEIINIEPYIDKVRIKINSFLGYEISAMQKRAVKHLSSISEDDINFKKACELLNIVLHVEEIDNSLIPDNSIIREFLI